MDFSTAALDVALLGGKGIYVENAAGRVEITRAGHGTSVAAAGEAPNAPRPWPQDKLRRAAATVTFP